MVIRCENRQFRTYITWSNRTSSVNCRRTAFISTTFIVWIWYMLNYMRRLQETFIEEPIKQNITPIECFTFPGKSLPDILTYNPLKGRSIFFHETSCKSYLRGKLTIGSRQACAVESAARMNPNYQVHLMFTSPGVIKKEGEESDRFLQALLSYSNVKFHRIHYDTYTKDTPVEKIYSSGKLEKSQYSTTHSSDLLRYLTLWRYGGIYLDLDVIVIKSLENLRPSYSGAQDAKVIAAGIMSFDHQGLGHEYAQQCLDDLKNNYNGKVWGFNGPGVVTRLVQRICNETDVCKTINKDCHGFKVFPKEIFYPISYGSWRVYFDSKKNDEVLKITNETYVLHFWNKLSENTKINITSEVPYSMFAKKYCPKVFAECDSFF